MLQHVQSQEIYITDGTQLGTFQSNFSAELIWNTRARFIGAAAYNDAGFIHEGYGTQSVVLCYPLVQIYVGNNKEGESDRSFVLVQFTLLQSHLAGQVVSIGHNALPHPISSQ
jgi:hypothetical protein